MVVLRWQLHLHRQGNNSLTTLAQTPLAQPPPGLTPQQQALLAEGLWWSAADLTRALGSVAEFKKLRGKRQNLWTVSTKGCGLLSRHQGTAWPQST